MEKTSRFETCVGQCYISHAHKESVGICRLELNESLWVEAGYLDDDKLSLSSSAIGVRNKPDSIPKMSLFKSLDDGFFREVSTGKVFRVTH